MAINTFYCTACGGKIILSKKDLKLWDTGEIETPDLCFDCRENEIISQSCKEEIYAFSDADMGL